MTKKEFALIAAALRTYYPKEKLIPNEQALELWFRQLSDLDYDLVNVIVNKWVSVNKWSPSIADIREQAAELVRGEGKTWGEAWGDVIKAIRWHGVYAEEEALKSLDELTRKIVKRMGYKSICLSENIATERANFRMIYKQEQQRELQDAQIPPKVKELLQKTNKLLDEGVDDEKQL